MYWIVQYLYHLLEISTPKNLRNFLLNLDFHVSDSYIHGGFKNTMNLTKKL